MRSVAGHRLKPFWPQLCAGCRNRGDAEPPPNLRKVELKGSCHTEQQSEVLTDAARLVVSGLARNEKSSLCTFRCEVDCGPSAIVALFSRHSEFDRVDLGCPVASYEFADATRLGLARLSRLRELQIKIGDLSDVIVPAICTLPLLRELDICLGNLPDITEPLGSLLSCIPTLEKLKVASNQAIVSLEGPVSPSLREITVVTCQFADAEPRIHPAFLNRTLSKLELRGCTFANEVSLLMLQQFQGLEKLYFYVCFGPIRDQPAPWFHLILGFPSLWLFHAEYDCWTHDDVRSVFPTDPVLFGVASALAVRDTPLDLMLHLDPDSRFAPSLCDLVRHSRGAVVLWGTQWPVANLSSICRGLEAPNCQLQRIDLRFKSSLGAIWTSRPSLRPRGAAGTSRACKFRWRALVLTTLALDYFSFSLEGFRAMLSGLASCKTATTLQLQGSSLSEGVCEILQSRLDDLPHLEKLVLGDLNVENTKVLRFLADVSRKLSRLRSLHLQQGIIEDEEYTEAFANACVEAVKTNPCLRTLEFFQFDTVSLEAQAAELNFFLTLNRLGRRHLFPPNEVSLALWPKILATLTGTINCGALYYFLRHKLALVRARGGGVRRLRADDA